MPEYNEDIKNSYIYLKKLLISKFTENDNYLLSSVVVLLIFLIYNYILFITFEVVYIYFLYNCFLGLGIGSAILYGVQKNRHTNTKRFFILALLFSFLAYLMLISIYVFPTEFYREFRLFLSARPLPMCGLYCCLTALIIGGSVFYRTKYTSKQLFFILIILFSFLAYLIFNHAIYLLYKYDWSSIYDIRGGTFKLLTLTHIFYTSFLVLGIRVVVLYGVQQDRYPSKKSMFILSLLSSVLAYLIFLIALYFSDYRVEISFLNFMHFLRCVIEEIPLTLNSSILSIILNVNIWLIEFLITSFSAWFFIIFTCPRYSPLNYSGLKGRIWFPFFMKESREKNQFDENSDREKGINENVCMADSDKNSGNSPPTQNL